MVVYPAHLHLVDSRFGHMVSKFRTSKFLPWNCVFYLYKSVPLPEKRPREGLKLLSKMALKK